MEIILDKNNKVRTEAHNLVLLRRYTKKDKRTGEILGDGWTETYYSNFKSLLGSMAEMELASMDKIENLWQTEVRLKKLIKSLPDKLLEKGIQK